jgi:hypothetical protein
MVVRTPVSCRFYSGGAPGSVADGELDLRRIGARRVGGVAVYPTVRVMRNEGLFA